MADCIKLQILDAFAALLETIPQFKTVLVSPPTPILRDDLVLPAVFVYDDTENVTIENRLELGKFNLQIEVWREGYNYARDSENDRADIKSAFYGAASLRALRVRVAEVNANKFYQEISADSEGSPIVGMGGIVVVFEVAYLTKYRDPYTQAGY